MGINQGFSRAGGGGGVSAATVQFEVYTATNASAQMAGGARYIPFTQGATDTAEMQCCIPVTGDAEVVLIYAMSAANAGNVELYLNRRISADAGDLDAAVTAGTQFTITPGAVTTRKSVTSAASSDLAFAVTEGDLLYLELGRTADAQDTHTGDFRLFGAYVKVTP